MTYCGDCSKRRIKDLDKDGRMVKRPIRQVFTFCPECGNRLDVYPWGKVADCMICRLKQIEPEEDDMT